MSRPIDLIVPDAGPLMSLAHGDHLELLQVFHRPVIILDVVKAECLKKPDAPDYERLSLWFEHGHNQFREAPTPFMSLYRAALEKEQTGEDPVATRGLGDAVLTWFFSNVDRYASGDAIPLVLTEDHRFTTKTKGKKVHILSTRAWLVALEEMGAIPSAEGVLNDIRTAGRQTSRRLVDHPAQVEGKPSDWMAAAEKALRRTR